MELVRPVTTHASEEVNVSNESEENEGKEDEVWQEVWDHVEGDLGQEVATEAENLAVAPGGVLGEEEEVEEGREAVGLTAPIKVSQKDREEHELTHTPYRAWCKCCVKGRGQKMPHLKNKDDEEDEATKVPRVSMDYVFMSQEDEEAKENPVLVVLNEATNERYARATGRKGVGTEGIMDWLVRDVSEEMKSWGHAGGVGGNIILKSDGEKAMVAFRDAVAKYHGGTVSQEGPAKNESQSNGAVEGAGRIVRDFTRVYKAQIEEKTGVEIESKDPILQWLIRWAAMVASRYLVGTDGKTGWERRRGRRCKIPVAPVGERVWYKQIRDTKERKNKLESEEKEGIWLGHARNSNETLIGTAEGVVRAYSVKRQDAKDRWDGPMIKGMQGTPQQPDPSRGGSTIPTRVHIDPACSEEPVEATTKKRELDARRMRITQEHLEEYGYTEGCDGCRFKRAGLSGGRAHSERCRKRIMAELEKTDVGRKAREREDQRIGSRVETLLQEDRRKEVPAEEGSKDVDMAAAETEVDEEVKRLVDEAIKAIEEETAVAEAIRLMSVEVMEMYSPPRVTAMGRKMGLEVGEAMDLTTGWDFTLERHRAAAWEYIRRVKPRLVIGSPMCRMFSSLQNLTKNKRRPEWEERFVEAKAHLKFMMEVYEEQWKHGRLFLHEHPAGATSWDLEEVKKLEEKTGAYLVKADQCMYGLMTWGKDGLEAVAAKKPTKFMTNSWEIGRELQKRCDGQHNHQELINGRAQWAARYPPGLCRAICKGLLRERQNDLHQVKCLLSVSVSDQVEATPYGDGGARERGVRHEEDDQLAQAWDDVTGEQLDSGEVKRARMVEIGYVREKRVWRKITRAEAMKRGIKVIKTRWLDINKGDKWNPNYRSRFVAKEFNDGRGGEAAWFAATPPLEALKLVLSDAATRRAGRGRRAIMINDVARAFFEAPVKRDICIELPEEDWVEEDGDQDLVGILERSLYGTRDAAANFQEEVKRFMLHQGFKQGKYNVCTFWHPVKDLKTMVHGDDFVTVGGVEEMEWLRLAMEERFQIKTQVIGHRESREGKVLNRVIRATEEGWEYEADQRHGEVIIRAMNLQDAKGVTSPGEEPKAWLELEDQTPLEPKMASEYRGLAARLNYLAMDRPDIQYATKEVCRSMSNPSIGDKRKLKRLARYLIEKPRLVSRFAYQEEVHEVDGYSDSDWAGCKRTAKSTSGGAIMVGSHCVKTWSATQKSITLSSGEAELVAAVKMSTELLGVLQLLADWGLEKEARVYVDSAAAIGITQRKGNGKLRHVKVGMLWIQEKVEEGELQVVKVLGTENPADAMTKHLNGSKIEQLMGRLSQESRAGRSELSLRL